MLDLKLAPRLLVLALAIAWFAYWGNEARSSSEAMQTARAAQFVADGRHDWSASEVYRAEARSEARDAALSIAIGFALPVVLLLTLEARLMIRPELVGSKRPR